MSNFADERWGILAQNESTINTLTAFQKQATERVTQEMRREEADEAALALLDDVFAPLLAEFQQVIEAEGVFQGGSLTQDHAGSLRDDATTHRQIYKARAAWVRQHFQVRLAAIVTNADTIELVAECVASGPRDMLGNPTWNALVELPRKSLLAKVIDDEAAREWCVDVLKQCAETLMDANFATPPGPAPVHAPITAFPGAFPMAGGVLST